MRKICDLHMHTIYSDGTLTPEELVLAAKDAGISAIALTDHNTVKGLPYFFKSSEENERLIGGIEFSTALGGLSFHILGLFIDKKYYDAVEQKASVYRKNKEISNCLLAENLKNGGFDIDFDDVRALCPEGNINRAVFASLLVNKGYAASVNEAITGILSKERGFFVPPEKPDSRDVIGFLREIGAVPVLAHPMFRHTEQELLTSLPLMKGAGLAAMETAHSEYDEQQGAKAIQLQSKFGLLPSGGSDYHGERKPDISLFSGKGSLLVPDEYFIELKKYNDLQRKEMTI